MDSPDPSTTTHRGWALIAPVALSLLVAACGGPPRVEGGPAPIDAPAAVPPPPTLTLHLSAHRVFARWHGAVCRGAITGELVVTGPDGVPVTRAVAVETMTEHCVGCLPSSPTADSANDCRGACQLMPNHDPVLTELPVLYTGRYTVDGAGLRLTCAPGATFVGAHADLVGYGPWRPTGVDAGAAVAAPIDAGAGPLATPDATAVSGPEPAVAGPSGRTGVRGRVVINHDAIDHDPVAGHRIVIRAASGKTRVVRTDRRGEFRVRLPPGVYTLRTRTPHWRRPIQGNQEITIEVTAGAEVEAGFAFGDNTRCLDAATDIATPRGPVAVAALRPGDPVWSCAVDGRVVIDRVLAVQAVDAPGLAVRLAFADGGALTVAAGHPLATGRLPGQLGVGELVAGRRVVGHTPARYRGGRSYDLRTGADRPYLAAGVPLWSTMAAAGPGVDCAPAPAPPVAEN